MTEQQTHKPNLLDPVEVEFLLMRDPRWMVGRRDDHVLVLRERGVTDGPWLSVQITEGAPAEIDRVDLVHGVLARHRVTDPGCTCGKCPESEWRCSCGLSTTTHPLMREHVARKVVETLDER